MTLSDWSQGDSEEALPDVVSFTDAEAFEQDIGEKEDGYDYIVIDGAANMQRILGATLRAADLVVIPVMPSPADVWAAVELAREIEDVQAEQNGRPEAFFLLSRCDPRSNASAEVLDALRQMPFDALANQTRQRVAYSRSMLPGRSVLDDPGSKAADEITRITLEIAKRLSQNNG